MKKISIYISDIMSTIIGSVPNTDKDYAKFIFLLNKLKEQDQSERIVFSLISTDEEEIVIDMKKKIESYSYDTITFGPQFFSQGYEYKTETTKYDSFKGKYLQILEYLDLLSEFYEIVSVYYADDGIIYQEMLDSISQNKPWHSKLHLLTPTQDIGIQETNSLIEKLIDEKEKKLLKK